jgi:uncharacterized sulfatase
MLRAVRDRRYKYIRNFMPHLPYAQRIDYMEQMPTTKEWRRLAAAGELTEAQRLFMAATKPAEELYDTQADPHETRNLAGSPEHQEVLQRMRQAQAAWMHEIRDLGLLPEAEIHLRAGRTPPYSMARQGESVYPLGRILEAALAAQQGPAALSKLTELLGDDDAAVRYWAATGLLALGEQAGGAADALRKALSDDSPNVRIAAAEALARQGSPAEALPVLTAALEHKNEWARLHAAIALDHLDAQARPALSQLRAMQDDANQYVGRVLGHVVPSLENGN